MLSIQRKRLPRRGSKTVGFEKATEKKINRFKLCLFLQEKEPNILKGKIEQARQVIGCIHAFIYRACQKKVSYLLPLPIYLISVTRGPLILT